MRHMQYFSISILLIRLMSSLAIEQTAQKYLPECLVQKDYRRLFSLTGTAVVARSTALLVVTECYYILRTNIVEFFSINDGEEIFGLWLLATVAVITYRFLNVVQQIFLQHKITKWISVALNASRLVAVLVWLGVHKEVSLPVVIWIEISANSVAVLFSSVYLFRELHRIIGDTDHHIRFLDVDARIARFAGYSYVRELLYIFTGHAMSRLVIGRFLPLLGLEVFGFAQSLMEFLSRYSPSLLLNNMIQPVVMGRHAKNKDGAQLLGMAELILKLNLFMFIPLFLVTILIGEGGSNYITNGKYPDAGAYLVGLIVDLDIPKSTLFFSTVGDCE